MAESRAGGPAGQLAGHGAGVWVPTVITQSHEHIAATLRTLAEAVAADPAVAAAIRCVHIEGPFILPLDGPRGAHDRQHVRDISVVEVRRWHGIFPVGYVTVSPHWEDAPRKISELRRLGVHVAIGHTHATAEEVAAASVAGATLSTHLGNGAQRRCHGTRISYGSRSPIPRWTPGSSPTDITCPPRCSRPSSGRKAWITASLCRTRWRWRVPAGRYTTPVGGDVVLSVDRRLALADDDRLLAGSAVSVADCVRFAVHHTQLSRSEVFSMATRVPGSLLADIGGGPAAGTITAGSSAHLVLWDADFELIRVVTG